MHQYIALEDTVYFGFAANLTTGAAGDGATPLYDVRLAGAAAGAAPVLSGTPTLLTHANYTDGLHEVAIAATAANGFAAEKTYLVFVTLTISSVTPAACIGSFKIAAVPANMTQILGTAVSTPATAGVLDTNVKNINNVAAATPGASGGVLIAGSNAAVTYASETITGTLTISDGIVVTRSTSNKSAIDATGNGTGHGIFATSGSGATGNGIQATSAATNGHGYRGNGAGNGAGMSMVGGPTGSGGAMTGGASGGSGLILAPQVASSEGLTVNGIGSGIAMKLTPGSTGTGLKVNGGSVSGSAAVFAHTGAGDFDIDADIHGTIDLATTVTSVTNAVTLTAAYDAAKTAATQTSVDDLPTNAELATALGTADDAVLTQVALVKAKTDSLTFTVAGQIDANIQYVNDVQVNGVGTAGNPWGP